MKKLIFILIAAISVNAVSAQSRNGSYQKQDRRQERQTDARNYNDKHRSKDYAYNDKGWKNDRDRKEAYDRMNEQYDQRIRGYRNDRTLSPYERDRRIHEAEQERQLKARSFGNGAIAGGIAGFLLGVLVGR